MGCDSVEQVAFPKSKISDHISGLRLVFREPDIRLKCSGVRVQVPFFVLESLGAFPRLALAGTAWVCGSPASSKDEVPGLGQPWIPVFRILSPVPLQMGLVTIN